eukprot:RCo019961
MALLDTISETLGRELHASEKDLLMRLSPQGIAKVNADIAKGASLDLTLFQLKVVSRATKNREALAQSMVPKALLPVMNAMSRPPTTDELVLLAGVPSATLLRQLEVRTKKGEVVEDILEELAEEHRLEVMRNDAQQLVEEKGRSACITYLSPTGVHPTLCAALSVSVTEGGSPGKIRVGPNPVLSWFCEPAQVTLADGATGEAQLECSVAMSATPASPSVLRKGSRRPRTAPLQGCTSVGSSPCTFASIIPPAELRVSFRTTLDVEGVSVPAETSRKRRPLASRPAATGSRKDSVPEVFLGRLKRLLLSCHRCPPGK